MAARQEALLVAGWEARETAPEPAAGRWAAAGLAVGAGALLALWLDAPAFFDNEGRYAEVAREMVLARDWISPHLDFVLFLNKPPLTFWLTALVFEVAGPTEWARLVSIAAAAVTVFAVCRIGALLLGTRAGLLAGVALVTMLGFALEARTLRPDMLVVAAVTVALLCWLRAETSPGRTRWLVAMYVALGTGVLAKGLVPLAVAGVPIAVVTLRDRGLAGIARLRPLLGLAVLAAVVLPWHVAVALRHQGFAWDYVVNQHLLFLFDEKLPRDSEGDTLGFFWGAFLGRALPWSLLLPLAVPAAVGGLRRVAPPEAHAAALLWAWAGGVLLLFSLAPSRLEHYSLPALPAVALLAACVWQRAVRYGLSRPEQGWLVAVGVAAAAVGGLGALYGPAFLTRTYWLAQVPALLALVQPAALVVLAGGLALAIAAAARRPGLVGAALAGAVVPLVPIVLVAEARAEVLFSWRPVARALAARVPADVEIVFEAPEEYQLVGGLAYYTARRITLLEVPGFVPPTYLADQAAGMFLSRDAFARRWRAGERLAFVSDPLRQRDDPAALVPGPFHVVGRFGDRWVLTSFPVSGAR